MISVASRREPHQGRLLWVLYGALGAVLVAYLVSLLVRGDNSSQLVDGWLVAAFELVGSGLCFLRAAGRPGHRAIPIAFGLGTLSWALGDIFLTAEGANVSPPSLADAFYLGFYPLVYVGLVLLVRHHARELTSAMWFDGLVAGLGAAGLSACFLFSTIVRTTGDVPAAVATNLAYPLGDVLLLALVVGVTAILPGRRNVQWILLALACAINAAGDTANLLRTPGSTWGFATVFDAVAWPTAILLISLALWLPGRSAELGATLKPAGMMLPGLGAISGLGILLFGSFRPVSSVAVGLATATLIVVGIRFWLSVGHLRTLTHKRHRQAVTDDLTGLGNRRQLFAMLDDFFADAADPTTPRRELGLLFIDLDHFKEINDSFGHSAGDELLRQLGPRLASTLRSSDVLVRVGGDELGVVIMDSDIEYATAVARRLIAKLEEPFALDAVNVRISASIGIATAPRDARDSAGLLRCADLAMYRAKLGASSYQMYRKEIDDDGSRLRLVEELRGAAHQGQFLVHYQPQVSLHTGAITAIEALLRWPHPRLGLVPPLDFLPLAEEAGLMPSITSWIVDEALAQCAAWRAGGHDLPVAVNVSVSNLLDDGFVGFLADALNRHHLPGSSLTMEITETTIINDFDGCRRVIGQLSELGIAVSIDDFGAGFTSLAYLGSLAVSELKLDRGFIRSLAGPTPDRDLALVGAVIDLGHALGMRVVAEGVEDAAVLEMLRGAGCDVAQGFFISHPMPAADLALAPVLLPAPPQLTIASTAS